jgi:hypothetical protein
VPSRKAGGAAVLREGHSKGVQANLITSPALPPQMRAGE